MKPVFISLSILGLLAACDTPEQSAAAGALIGAGVGAATAGHDETGGAALGAAVGAVGGLAAHGAKEPSRRCYIPNADGTRTYVECPS